MLRMPVAVLFFAALLSGSLLGPVTAQVTPAVPAPNTLTILIKNTLAALNHANLTGNYTVLRDLGAPGFSQANTAARLVGCVYKFAFPTPRSGAPHPVAAED